MKYIRKEIIETVLVNEDIKDASEILDIFDFICKYKIDASVSFSKDGSIPQAHKKVRVNSINRDTLIIDITVFTNNATLRIRDIPVGAFNFLEIAYNANDHFSKSNDVNRTSMLDLS